MRKLITWMKKLAVEETGASLTEYALLAILVAIFCFVAVALLGSNLRDLYNIIARSFP
jgi:Flp pilus assembly pilin Flp